jgi:CRISPR-associated protein (TIGR03986 family)
VADPIRGKLVWQGTGDKRVRRVVYPTKKGISQPTPFDAEQLAAALRGNAEDEVEVDLELQGGKPVRIRPVGQPFAAAAARPQQPSSSERHPARGDRPSQGRGQSGPRDQGRGQQRRPQSPPAFHNPYNFVPAPPRNTAHVDLGDHAPIGHHRYHGGWISGSIRVKMTLKTPLLLPDAARLHDHKQDNPSVGIKKGHKDFPVRVDADGNPLVPPTSVKGMLRSAYEAVTNSRLAVFAGHEDRLADRMPARDGLSLVPARIVAINGTEVIELLPGDSGISGCGRPTDNDPMYAAWLPRYDRQTGQVAHFAVRYQDNSLPQHRDAVEVWLELWERTGQPPPGQRRGTHQPVHGRAMISVRGSVCVTNRNIDRKHDERVFFTTRDTPVHRPLTDGLRQQWGELIRNYQTIHQAECDAGMTGPPALNNSIWSRQIVGGEDERNLTAGTLCHAAFYEGTVIALYPVMISRRLFESSPLSLLPSELQPATAMGELSPADRVFGWVSQRGQGAYRGNVRIGPVTCESPDAIERFGEPGLPLAILGQPKEQQARFYVSASSRGEAQTDGLSKEEAGYRPGKGLRGRKVYPHHRSLPEGHWTDPMTDRTQQANGGHFQEYRRSVLSGQDRDNQNRSIHGWVKPETTFAFDLHVTNLSRVELGALLWLLMLDEVENQGKPPEKRQQHFHRIGGGKPLGFGSVRLEIDKPNTHLHDGNGWKQFYSTLDPCSPPEVDREAAITSYKEAVIAAYGPNPTFDEVSFLKAFLQMAKGFEDNLPIHYPRTRQGQTDPVPPNPAGESFQWFVANDHPGPQVSLPDLAADSGLPMLNARRQGG